MTNHKISSKQFAALGLRKSETGDYVYIDPTERHSSKYKPIDRRKSDKNDSNALFKP